MPHRNYRRGLKNGYRSGLEDSIAEQLQALNIPVRYEEEKIKYKQPEVERTYTPDFILPNGIIIETKGRFTVEDRKKHLLIKKQLPHLDLRFVFQNPNNRIYKGSKTTYAAWCEKHGFLYAAKRIPKEWLSEEES